MDKRKMNTEIQEVQLKTYPAYKDSGVEWFGEIPEHWELMKLKHLMKIYNGVDYKHVQVDDGYPVIGSGGQFAYASEYLYDGEVVLLGRKGTIDKPLYFNGKFWTVDTMFYAVANKNNITKFLYYLGSMIPFKFYSTSTALPSMTQDDLNNHKVATPPLSEQTAIANFLDDKCAKIDAAVEIKQQQIELLKERRQIAIHQAVTQGLNKNVPMKDSGIEWIGKIPAHWEVKRFRNVFSLGKGLTITKENLRDMGVKCVNYGEIHSKYGFELDTDIHELKCVDENYVESNPNSLISKGDFVFADTSEDIEGSGNFTYLESKDKIFAGYHTVTARPKENVFSRFFAYEFDSDLFRNQIRERVKGVKVYSITQSILKEPVVWIPPKEEQIEIANFLDIKTQKIDAAISHYKQEIEKLKEYKTTLINSAVTGKIRVNYE